MRLRKFVPGALWSLVTLGAFPAAGRAADTYIAPQTELFITHNKVLRSHCVVSGNWLTSEDKFASAWAQVDVDFGIVPFFRRYLFKDPNAEKSKFVTFRLAYLQVTDLKDQPNGFDEKRPFAEVVFRVPLGRAWLVEDRNRGEYRSFDDYASARYRNRVRLERNVLIHKFRLTPYGTGEVFYDGKADRWNEVQAAFGIDFPWYYRTILELECMGQFVEGDYTSLSFGLVLQKHI